MISGAWSSRPLPRPHYTLAREALLAGRHVYVEKTAGAGRGEARELIGLARDRHTTLMVGHLLQYHPVFVRLKELAAGGELGRINYIYSNRLNLGKIRREENALWSFAPPHDNSMILALAGEDPERVSCTGGSYLHAKIADVTTTHLEFVSGLRAHVFVSWLHPFKEQKLVVGGGPEDGGLRPTRFPGETSCACIPMRSAGNTTCRCRQRPNPSVWRSPEAEPLRCECEAFLGSMTDGRQPCDGR